MKRLVAAVADATVAVAGLAIDRRRGRSHAAPGHRAKAVKASGYTPPPLHWGKCTDPDLAGNPYGIKCADLVVPLDYAKPNGTKITVRVSRKQALLARLGVPGRHARQPGRTGRFGPLPAGLRGR